MFRAVFAVIAGDRRSYIELGIIIVALCGFSALMIGELPFGSKFMFLFLSYMMLNIRELRKTGWLRVMRTMPINSNLAAFHVWTWMILPPTFVVAFGSIVATCIGRISPSDAFLFSFEMLTLSAVNALFLSIVGPIEDRFWLYPLLLTAVGLFTLLSIRMPLTWKPNHGDMTVLLVTFGLGVASFLFRRRLFWFLSEPSTRPVHRWRRPWFVFFTPRIWVRARIHFGPAVRMLVWLSFLSYLCSFAPDLGPKADIVRLNFVMFFLVYVPLFANQTGQNHRTTLRVYRTLPLSVSRLLLLINCRNMLAYLTVTCAAFLCISRLFGGEAAVPLQIIFIWFGISAICISLEFLGRDSVEQLLFVGTFLITWVLQLGFLSPALIASRSGAIGSAASLWFLWAIAGGILTLFGIYLQYKVITGDSSVYRKGRMI